MRRIAWDLGDSCEGGYAAVMAVFFWFPLIPQNFIYNIFKVPEQQKVAQNLAMSKKITYLSVVKQNKRFSTKD